MAYQILSYDIRRTVNVLREAVIEILLKHELTLWPDLMKTLAIGIRYHAVSITVNDQSRSLILGSRLIDRQ